MNITQGQPFPDPNLVSMAPSVGWYADDGLVLIVDHHMTPERAAAQWEGARVWGLGTGPLVVLVMQLADGIVDAACGWGPDMRLPEWAQRDLGPQERIALTMVSVDYPSRVVANIRFSTLSPHFSQRLAREVRDRWTEQMDGQTLLAEVERYRGKYVSPVQIKRDAFASSRLGD